MLGRSGKERTVACLALGISKGNLLATDAGYSCLCAAFRASYKGAVKGLAYVASALDSHWQRVGPALQSAVESEVASRKGRLPQTVSSPWCLVSSTVSCSLQLKHSTKSCMPAMLLPCSICGA